MFVKKSYLPIAAIYPLRVFALVMFVIFAVEGAIMLAFPVLPAWTRAPVVEGILDASVLTLVTGPAVWWLAVVPIRRLFEARGELLHRLFRVQEEERARIARDLHDEIGQHLTALLVGLRTVESASDLPEAITRARALRELGVLAHDEVRRLARGLRPGVIDEFGLQAAIDRLCEDFQRAHGVDVDFQVAPEACSNLTKPVESALYRILQEALTNVARHAAASKVQVTLLRSGDAITMTIEDDGRGFAADKLIDGEQNALSVGLDSMRERARTLDGECTIDATAGRGTVVSVAIPLSG